MNTDKIDPGKKDAKISSTDNLAKSVELSEKELERVTGGGTVKAGYDVKKMKEV